MIKSQIRLKATLSALILLSLVVSACGAKGKSIESPSPSSSSSSSTTPAPTESSSASPSETPNVSILKQFQEQAMAGQPADELFASFKQIIGDAQPAEADEIVRALEAFYEKNLPDAGKKFEADNVQQVLTALKWPISEEQAASIKVDTIKRLVQETLGGGYKLETAEGFIFPIVDYGKLLSYGDRVTTPMKTYLDLMATESESASAEDGGLIITLDELSSRTLAAESYVVNFPDSPERSRVEGQFINYLSMYLVGLDNTPIFDYDTFVLLPAVKKQYEQMVASHAGTITGQMTKQLLDVLGKSGDAVFVKNKNGEQTDIPAVKQFRDQIESNARSKLPVGKK
ncbi:hypothetical protein [Cohnella silvisoli]|uniref:Uncharacterized protein n=1 Tax=Cohnella silvisoli TaxID=2873699 RepID=A0ABV1KX76_9BACL|nr:hypothetical protein [Cohnella silvisoli]MCD9024108.1 hypothetical protein [Cohnella silvisoli]